MGIIKHILFRNFWGFLFVLSGLVDLGIGIVSHLTGALTARNSFLPTFAICFIVGFFYPGGIATTTIKFRKPKLKNNLVWY